MNRADRVVKDQKILFSGTPKPVGPLASMENFLSDYKKGFVPPEHDVNTPIPLKIGLIP